jgi:predicted RNase H-like HicB family nuclease
MLATYIKQQILKLFGGSLIPLIQKALFVTQTASSVLVYIIDEIVSDRLEIPKDTVIPETMQSIVDGIDAVSQVLIKLLEYFGVSIADTPEASSNIQSVEELNKRVEELNSILNKK